MIRQKNSTWCEIIFDHNHISGKYGSIELISDFRKNNINSLIEYFSDKNIIKAYGKINKCIFLTARGAAKMYYENYIANNIYLQIEDRVYVEHYVHNMGNKLVEFFPEFYEEIKEKYNANLEAI